MSSFILLPGQCSPLGATPGDDGVNFAVFSAHATAVFLCLFDERYQEISRMPLFQEQEGIWHGFLPGADAGLLYAYRADGSYEPESGHRFDSADLLVDPYGKSLVDDDGELMCQVVTPPVDGLVPKPDIPWCDTVIYELHVKGFTQQHPCVKPEQRGTFSALAHPNVISHIQSLGVTSVQLMPVHGFVSEPRLAALGLSNYWGYNSINFFAPHPAYLSGDDVYEFRQLVNEYHRHGLEIILDVVFNHSGEGDQTGPTYSFRGLDNATYYRLAEDKHYYINDNGTGNALNLNHPQVQCLVVDSLRYWVEVMGVDGFRFDLATSLGRNADSEGEFNPASALLAAMTKDPVLAKVKLIAEPWDIGKNGYHLGQFPSPFREWNDVFRDTWRRFWRGDEGVLPVLADIIHGSAGKFEHKGQGPSSSINFITCHDGFTLADLVSYQAPHNHSNGENNRDGHQTNYSDNHGEEGTSLNPAILALRNKQRRNLLMGLFLSQGVPMLLAGDEFGNTQSGNNNAYCQDNETSWLNWEEKDKKDLTVFISRLVDIRRQYALLCPSRYLHDACESSAGFIWLNPDGGAMSPEDWQQEKAIIVLISWPANERRETLWWLLNSDNANRTFKVPKGKTLIHSQDSEPEWDNGYLILDNKSSVLWYEGKSIKASTN